MTATNMKFSINIVLLVLGASSALAYWAAPPSTAAPLANLDKLLRQTNSQVRIESLMDSKMANNMTSILNDMVMSMNKMVLENKRLSTQVQEVLNRVQNSTGVNGTTTLTKLQQQAPSMTSNLNDLGLSNFSNLTNLASRFQN